MNEYTWQDTATVERYLTLFFDGLPNGSYIGKPAYYHSFGEVFFAELHNADNAVLIQIKNGSAVTCEWMGKSGLGTYDINTTKTNAELSARLTSIKHIVDDIQQVLINAEKARDYARVQSAEYPAR